MEIAVLTSSRADFGFYKPLLEAFKKEKRISARLIVFGTHLSKSHGYTINQITESGQAVFEKIETSPKGDSPKDIANTIGLVHTKFASFWKKNKFDLILCLGDRYEMFAAVSASVPFNIPVAHISGGEETLGAIDNFYRHALTLIATYHFTNTKKNADRVAQIKNSTQNIYCTGSLAIDNINSTRLYSMREFKSLFGFDIDTDFILFTFHPETANYKTNIQNGETLKELLSQIKFRVLVTMPNADTMGNTIRQKLISAASENSNISLVESLGSKGYYTALKYCNLVMGNSSSGIVEAASFKKYVVNIGNRQLGRERGKNIIDVDMDSKKILNAINSIGSKSVVKIANIYGDGNAAVRISKIIKEIKFL